MKVSDKRKSVLKLRSWLCVLAILTGILWLFSFKSYADQTYTCKYQKISIKKSGFYNIHNKASSYDAVSCFALKKKKSAKATPLMSLSIWKGNKTCVYLKKGTYYLEQSIGEYETGKVFNRKVKVSSAIASDSYLTAEKYFTFSGVTQNAVLYLKLKAPKTGVISVDSTKLVYGVSLQQPSVTLCNSKKKAISSMRTVRYYNVYGSNEFAVKKGTTYYLRVKMPGNVAGYTIRYSYKSWYDGMKSGGDSKKKAVKLTKGYENSLKCQIGYGGAESQWFVYYGESSSLYLSYSELSWLTPEKKNGFYAAAYDQSGKRLSLTYEYRDGGYTIGSGAEEGPIYFKVSVKKNCPSYFSIGIH